MGFSQAGKGLLAVCLCFLVSPAFTRDPMTRAEVDSLNAKGVQMLGTRRPRQARVFFKKVHDTFPGDIHALLGLVDADFQERNREGAVGRYDPVRDRDPENPAAHYGKAISRREIGKYAGPDQRMLTWRSARSHIRRLTVRDSACRDMLCQWACWNGSTGFIRI